MAAAAELAIMLPMLLAAAGAQPSPANPPADDVFQRPRTPVLALPAEPRRKGLSFRIADEVERDGVIRLQRGIVAGFEVAPDALIGIGLFETMPKRIVRSEQNDFERMPKRKRKAAVGLSLKF